MFGLNVQAQSDRPNFVFIITDDQDFHMGTLPHMTEVTEKLINEGTFFEKHFCTSESKISVVSHRSFSDLTPVAHCLTSMTDPAQSRFAAPAE